MRNIEKIIILILFIIMLIFVIKTNETKNNIGTSEQLQNEEETNLSTVEIPILTVQDEKNLEEQEVEDEGF